MLGTKTKASYATKPYTINLSQYLAEIPGDRIVAAEWAVAPDGEMLLSSHSYSDTAATVWAAGGVEGKTYTVSLYFTTESGIRDMRSFQIVIQPQ